VDPTTVFDFVPYPAATVGDVDLYLKQDVFLTSFANGVRRDMALPLYGTQRPFAFSAGNQPSGPAAWQTIPSRYLPAPAARRCRATRPTGPRGVLPCVDCNLTGRRCHPRLR
jgi:hypothetical protein